MRFSFCESVTASSMSPWHIRRIPTDTEPLKLGGGITSGSLCGVVKPVYGWDVPVPLTPHHLKYCCRKCRAALEELES